jgi:hypothetical protein
MAAALGARLLQLAPCAGSGVGQTVRMAAALGARLLQLVQCVKVLCWSKFRMAAAVERLHWKRPIPICRLFFKIYLLTDIAALCLTDFIDWRYIH